MKWRALTTEECKLHAVPVPSAGFVTEEGTLYCDTIFSVLPTGAILLPSFTEVDYADLVAIIEYLRDAYLKGILSET